MCNLEPQRSCKHVTKLVPLLKPVEDCVDIPKEVCVRSRRNPRRIKKPIVKKWCYTPKESPPVGGGSSLSDSQLIPGCLRGRPFGYCEDRRGDGRCDPECNIRSCQFDGGDCRPPPPPPETRPPPPPPTRPPRQGCLRGRPYGYCENKRADNRCDPECNIRACQFDGGDCRPPPTRPPTRPPRQGCLRGRPYGYCENKSANGVCDEECNNSACRYGLHFTEVEHLQESLFLGSTAAIASSRTEVTFLPPEGIKPPLPRVGIITYTATKSCVVSKLVGRK